MANKKFSELTEVTTPNSESIFATAYDGDNFKVTLTNIAANMPSITTTGTVTGTTFIGNVTGNVTGSVTGNADTATALATGRSIGMTGDVTWTSASFDGTGNVTGTASIGTGVIINADVNASAAIDASKIHDGTVSNTEFGYLNGVSSAIQTQIDTKITASSTDTLTNKTINTASNTITIVEADISDLGSYITASSTDTLTNKTFDANGTGNSLSNVEVADLASGVLDTDISTVSASDDTLASAKAIKTYVDSQVTAQDLDFQADTGGALSIDLDSETLTFTGGTGIDTSGLGNAVTFAIDSTVATLSGTQTLTNKSGNISQWTNDSAYLTGNQTITLSGDASGSGTTAITVTVADDSHNHIISNVDGLQTALDAKLANVVEDTTPQLGGDLDANGNDINFGDNDKAIFGAGPDLSIYHDGSNSIMAETGTGGLAILSSSVQIENAAGDETMASFTQDGSVSLRYNNVEKFVTTTDGVDITSTGSIKVPVGTTAQRNSSPANGDFRFNSTTSEFEGYDGSAWGSIGGGASAGGAIYENTDDITSDYTITSGSNGFSVGPMTIASGVTVTVPSGQRWVIL